ncbi:MAG: cache domain-containing protein, partial [Nitrospinales bacterium]
MMTLRKNSIFCQLLLYFFPIALFPLVFGILFTYFQAKSSLTQQIINNLHSISIRQTSQIESYVRERFHAVKSLSQMPDLISAFNKLEKAFVRERGNPVQLYQEGKGFHPSPYAVEDKRVRPFLKSYLKEHSYEDLLLISMNGDVMFSISRNVDLGSNLKTGPYRDTELARVFNRAQTLLETEISRFDYFDPAKKPAGFIAGPIFDGRKFLGVIVIMINNRNLYKIVNDYKGLQQTGEILVASKVGDEAVFMAPLRFDKNAALKRKIKIGSQTARPIQKAVQKQTGSGLALDYRGEEVLAHWTYLPSIKWGVVVKIDSSEAFAPIHHLREFLIYFAIGSALLMIGVILYMSKQMSQPVVKLTQWIKLLAEEDISEKIERTTENEIGQLMTAFTEMTNQLHRSQKSLK